MSPLVFVRTLLVALSLVAVTSGCRRRAPAAKLVAPAQELRLYNRGGTPVGGVRVKPCRAPETDYQWLPASQVSVGGSLGIPLQPGCVDLSAVSPDGRELGRQFDLSMIPGSTWEIR